MQGTKVLYVHKLIMPLAILEGGSFCCTSLIFDMHFSHFSSSYFQTIQIEIRIVMTSNSLEIM